jgi:hypothetical protein
VMREKPAPDDDTLHLVKDGRVGDAGFDLHDAAPMTLPNSHQLRNECAGDVSPDCATLRCGCPRRTSAGQLTARGPASAQRNHLVTLLAALAFHEASPTNANSLSKSPC